MTQQRDITSLLDLWLAEGSKVAPDRVINVVTDRIERQGQRGAWRFPAWEIRMPALVRFAAVATALAVVAAGAIYFAGSTRPSLAPPTRGPSPTAVTSPKPSPTPYVLPSGLPYPSARTIKSTESHPGFQLDVPTGWDSAGSTGGLSLTLGLIHDDAFGDLGNIGGGILFRLNPVLGNVNSCPGTRTAAPTLGPATPASVIVAALLADPRFSVVANPEITIDGRAAQVLDVGLAPGYAGSCMGVGPSALLFDEPGSFVVVEGDKRGRLILLDVDAVPLVILISPEEETADAFITRAMGLINGLTFLP